MKNLTILDYYLEHNKIPSYVEEYQSTSYKKSGKTFWHTNVNFRSLYSFIDTFKKFQVYDNKDRKTWELYENNQQKAKQWTVRMQQSKLFKKIDKTGAYSLTAKGEAFKDFVYKVTYQNIFNDNEKWIIIFDFVLNAYFNLKPNYVFKRANEVYNELIINGFSSQYLNSIFLELLKKGPNLKKSELFKLDAFWILTFYKDKDFLSLYKEASEEEKNFLFEYVITNSTYSKEEIKRRNDLVSKKFMSGGQYTISTFIDDVKTLYVAYNVYHSNNTDCFSLICNIYTFVSNFDSNIELERLLEFIKAHEDVFQIVYNEAILSRNVDTELNNESDLIEEIESDIVESKIDDTTTKTQKQLRKASQILKRTAKEKAGYRCELETLNACKYFTSKEDGKNYLEIHHLVPFEFSNDFDVSLEVIENYVALCPHCHRLIHLGADRERKMFLSYLFNQRKSDLKSKGIIISLEELLAYYGIEEK